MRIEWAAPGDLVDDSCPVCDVPGPHPVLLRAAGHVLVRCTGCTACFYRDRSPPEYAAGEESGILTQLYVEQNAGIDHMTRILSATETDGVDSLLDVGCGFGFPTDFARRVLGWRSCGIDPSPLAGEGARLLQGADIRREYLTEETPLGQPFGMIMGSEVIEHVPDPLAFLGLLRRWLKPGGLLALTTPDSGVLRPGMETAGLVPMLSVGAHLVLFSAASAEYVLRRAGFAHVHTRCSGGNLQAWASDLPVRFRADADARHARAYRAYLHAVMDEAEPGTPLWNGVAGRLLALLAPAEGLEAGMQVSARIGAAWRDRLGLNLARPARLSGVLGTEAGHSGLASGHAGLEHLARTQPLNLAPVLLGRALLAHRTPGRDPGDVLAPARAAMAIALHNRRTLQGAGLDDFDLQSTAWRARMLVLDCLVEQAPELEGELLAALAQPSPGALHEEQDPPPAALVHRIAPVFCDLVHAGRYDAALRLEPLMRDMDLVCAALSHDPERRLHALFTLGVLRLNAMGQTAAAHEAFLRMAADAAADPLPGRPDLAAEFLRIARDHVTMTAAPQEERAA